jgi:hypothetical protein
LGILVPIALWLFVYSLIGLVFTSLEEYKRKITDMLFYDKTFMFIAETYILLAMCAAINFHYFVWDSAGNATNALLSCFIMGVLVSFPIFTGIFYSNPYVVKSIYYRKPEFMKKYGSLVQELNMHRHGPRVVSYLVVGMFRKLWLVLILVFM